MEDDVMDMPADYLQNEVILILHHVEDALKGLSDGDVNYARKGLEDIREVADRMKSRLPRAQREGVSEIESMASSWVLGNCRFARDKQYLDQAEREDARERFGEVQCSFARDEDGYYCYTHRARSDSYESIAKIPKKIVEFISSTS